MRCCATPTPTAQHVAHFRMGYAAFLDAVTHNDSGLLPTLAYAYTVGVGHCAMARCPEYPALRHIDHLLFKQLALAPGSVGLVEGA